MSEQEPSKPYREVMSRVDTAWLRMERATNLMMITGVMMFDIPMPIEKFKKVVKQRFLAYPRFRQKVIDTTAGAWWETDEDFDLDWHIRLTALPGKAGKKELERLTS
ncbi:MAG: wax ester/triacylglycerol synthase domain-containing protein, partial [Methylococcales bacterium]